MSICKNGLCLSALAVIGSFGLTAAILSGCGGAQGVTTGASSPSSITIKHGKEKTEGGAVATTKGEGGSTAAPAAEGGFGNLKGRVVFQGTAPPLEPLTEQARAKDALCVKEHGVPNDKLVIGEGNGVANVFIFLPKAWRWRRSHTSRIPGLNPAFASDRLRACAAETRLARGRTSGTSWN